MRTTTYYNFAQIINEVLAGKINTLYIIASGTYGDDKEHTGDLKWYNEPYFAGTTIQEAQDTMNAAKIEVAKDVEYYQRITLFANKITVSPADFSDFSGKAGDAWMAIEEIVDAHKDGAEDVPEAYNGEWDLITDVYPEYESMEDGILVYYRWEPYVGYARKFCGLEYCIEDKTTLECKPTERAFSMECEMLVSPAEVRECSSASELREMMNERLRSMGLWKWHPVSHYDEIDAFLDDCYNNDSYNIYKLPDNDYYKDNQY